MRRDVLTLQQNASTFVIAVRYLGVVSDVSRLGFCALINLTLTLTRNPDIINHISCITANWTEHAT
jgi:hypothetical protein